MSVSAIIYIGSMGLAKTLRVPVGTHEGAIRWVESVGATLGLRSTKYRDNPAHWEKRGWPSDDIADDPLCDTVMAHNRWVFAMHDNFADWSENPVEGGEDLTPEMAQEWWHGMTLLSVPPDRWSKAYYRDRMEHLYEVMRGRNSEATFFDAKPLTPQQAGAVIRLFETYLDPEDLRLAVPKGCDFLADQEEYEWCERCGAVTPDHAEACRRRGCPVQRNWKELES